MRSKKFEVLLSMFALGLGVTGAVLLSANGLKGDHLFGGDPIFSSINSACFEDPLCDTFVCSSATMASCDDEVETIEIPDSLREACFYWDWNVCSYDGEVGTEFCSTVSNKCMRVLVQQDPPAFICASVPITPYSIPAVDCWDEF